MLIWLYRHSCHTVLFLRYIFCENTKCEWQELAIFEGMNQPVMWPCGLSIQLWTKRSNPTCCFTGSVFSLPLLPLGGQPLVERTWRLKLSTFALTFAFTSTSLASVGSSEVNGSMGMRLLLLGCVLCVLGMRLLVYCTLCSGNFSYNHFQLSIVGKISVAKCCAQIEHFIVEPGGATRNT